MQIDLIQYFLPEQLVKYFEITDIQELGEIKNKRLVIEITLVEKNTLPPGYDNNEYESKGFLPECRIQDFPIRGKALYLRIKRRRWRHKKTKQEIKSDYSFIAEGARLTEDLSDFLKATGRDPRRHD